MHEQVYNLPNIELADRKARRHKSVRWGILKHDKRREKENLKLAETLRDLTYKTSNYSTFKIYEPKERLIFRLPYYPDRITHHAIMNIMEPIWVNIFIKHTYSCIKDRGIHDVAKDLKYVLQKYPEETKYCLKLDVRKFYPSIDHDILYEILQKKIKDKKLLTLLKEIIYSADGVPIGNYLSQFFANLYLAYFDHWVKEELKQNYQIFPVDSRGIDFVGYKFFHTHVLLRKSIKVRLFRLIKRYKDKKIDRIELRRRMQSYFGWLKFCNSKNLLHKIQLETGLRFSNWNGKKVNISKFYGKYVHIVEVMNYSKYFRVHCVYKHKSYYFESKNKQLFYSIHRYSLPVNFKITPYVRPKKNRNKPATRTD